MSAKTYQPDPNIRHNWTRQEVEVLLASSLPDLIFKAQQAHRRYFNANEVQLSTLLSIKTGACPEDCAYCPQSVRFATGLEREELLSKEAVIAAAKRAKAAGATRFCMGAAWRRPKDKNLAKVIEMVEAVKALGMETCATLGMLKKQQAEQLAAAGLDYYNHNLDSSPEYYAQVITTRTYQDRLDTLDEVCAAGLKVCCGGIIGMGETINDRAGLLCQLANMPQHPTSVPINNLVQVKGTPLYGTDPIDPLDFVRVIAVAKIMLPASYIRLAAGRQTMSEQTQALCFLAGANSIFYGDELLTTANPKHTADLAMLDKLGMRAQTQPKYTQLPYTPAQPDAALAPQI